VAGDKKGGFDGVLPVAPVVAPATAVAPMAIAPMQNYGGKKGYRRSCGVHEQLCQHTHCLNERDGIEAYQY
jgi:hypothetical protein